MGGLPPSKPKIFAVKLWQMRARLSLLPRLWVFRKKSGRPTHMGQNFKISQIGVLTVGQIDASFADNRSLWMISAG